MEVRGDPFSSLLPYGLDGGRAAVVARVHTAGPSTFADDLRFDPWYTGPALQPVGVLNRLRRPAYQASQQGRRAPGTGVRAGDTRGRGGR